MGSEEWRTVAVADGIRARVATDWETLREPANGVVLVSLQPATDGFRANHVWTLDRLPADMDLRSWQLGNDQLLSLTLDEYVLLDLERTEVDGYDAVRRLACHSVQGEAVTMTQLAFIFGGIGVTLTSTVSTMRYLDLANDLVEVQAGLSVGSN